ncbi:MAG: DNA primase [Marinifilaceae bacterium]
MSNYIPKEIIGQILQCAKIEEVVSGYMKLTKKGANYMGCCPFHGEKTPSFSVSPARGIYKCFGCGKGGNVISFVQEYEGIDFVPAAKLLAAKYNIQIPEIEMSPEDKLKERHRESMLMVMRSSKAFFQSQLHNKAPKAYLEARGWSIDSEILEKYGVGFALPGAQLQAKLHADGYSFGVMEETGMIGKGERGHYDYFRNRIVFPFYTISGNVIGFTGREIADGDVKYLNTKETTLFHKGAALFGLYQAKKDITKNDKIYFVEGQFDVLAMVSAGVPNTICGSGTALTEDQCKMMLRFTRNITLVYDGDAAGLKAAIKNIEILVKMGAAVRCLPIPDGEDPDSFARKMGEDQLKKYITAHEVGFVQFLTSIYHTDFLDAELKDQRVTEIAKLIACVERNVTRGQYISELAGQSGCGYTDVVALVKANTIPFEDSGETDCFFGIDEAKPMLKDDSSVCLLTNNFETFMFNYLNMPVVYFRGTPDMAKIQEFRRTISTVEFKDDDKLEFTSFGETIELSLLKSLYKAGVTISIPTTVKEDMDGRIGFVDFYVKIYAAALEKAPETIKADYIDRCADVISFASETVRAVQEKNWAKSLGLSVSQYKRVITPHVDKRKSKSAINIQKQNVDNFLANFDPEQIPDYVESNDEYKQLYNRFGYYPLINKEGTPIAYMFKMKDNSGHLLVGDFYMEPLLHVQDPDPEFNKRIIKFNRMYSNRPLYLEVKSKALVSLTSFNEVLINEEALNFENGDVKTYTKIRQAMSYKYTTCTEIKTFGQQQENFFAFSNAIFHKVDDEYKVEYVNDLGVTTHDGINYYAPAFSKIYANMSRDNDKYEQHRFFVYKEIPENKRCSFKQWAELMDEVYKINDNGKWAIIYAIMCAFRSDIHIIDRLFTALFFVGPTMSGKTQIAISIRSLFVDPQAPSFNLNSGTDAAFFTLMEGFRDVPQVLEEYNNKDITDAKFQGLKSIVYDGDGKQKRKGVSGKEIETSKVYSPVILLGQETPQRDDNALMNRVIICEVPKSTGNYTPREVEVFQKLKGFEKSGLCNVLVDVLKLRPLIREKFMRLQKKVIEELKTKVSENMNESGDMTRIINTISLFLTTCKLIETEAPHLQLPFSYDDLMILAIEKVKTQLEMISTTDKLSGFFKAMEVMINSGAIKEGRDYDINIPGKITVKDKGKERREITLAPSDLKVLHLRLSVVHAMYMKSSYNTEDATLSTIAQNLRSHPAYIGEENSKRFTWDEVAEVPKGLTDGGVSNEMKRIVKKRSITSSCIALNYDAWKEYFDIDLERKEIDDEEESFLF